MKKFNPLFFLIVFFAFLGCGKGNNINEQQSLEVNVPEPQIILYVENVSGLGDKFEDFTARSNYIFIRIDITLTSINGAENIQAFPTSFLLDPSGDQYRRYAVTSWENDYPEPYCDYLKFVPIDSSLSCSLIFEVSKTFDNYLLAFDVQIFDEGILTEYRTCDRFPDHRQGSCP